MNILDLIVLGFIAFMILQGMSKGLILSFFNLAYFFLSIFLAVKFYPLVSSIIANTQLFSWIKEKVSNSIYHLNLEQIETASTNQELINTSTVFDNMALPEGIKDLLIKKNNSSLLDLLPLDGIMEGISEGITNLIINIISIMLIYFIARIGLSFVANILNKFAKLPIVNMVNKLAGGFFGLISGVCMIYLAFAFLTLLANIKPFSNLITYINSSTIASIFYNHNLLLLWIF